MIPAVLDLDLVVKERVTVMLTVIVLGVLSVEPTTVEEGAWVILEDSKRMMTAVKEQLPQQVCCIVY